MNKIRDNFFDDFKYIFNVKYITRLQVTWHFHCISHDEPLSNTYFFTLNNTSTSEKVYSYKFLNFIMFTSTNNDKQNYKYRLQCNVHTLYALRYYLIGLTMQLPFYIHSFSCLKLIYLCSYDCFFLLRYF